MDFLAADTSAPTIIVHTASSLADCLLQSCDAIGIDGTGEFSVPLDLCRQSGRPQAQGTMRLHRIALEQGSLLVLVCEPMTFLQSNGPASHEPREALRQMPTATAPGWRGPERAEPGMSARAGEPPALLLELPLCRALQFFARARSPVSFMRMMCPQARLKKVPILGPDLALRKHEVNPGSGRLQYVDVNRTI